MTNLRLLSAVLMALLLLGSLTWLSSAQETPAFATAAFDESVNFRQNVCDRQDLFHNKTVQLRNALEGLELRVLTAGGTVYRDKDTNAIQEDYPGPVGLLLDELALRAKFTWRSSYGIVTSRNKSRTFDELLTWQVNTYDVAANRWTEDIERLALGISFPEGWEDGSIILVGMKGSSSSGGFDFFSFLEPLDWGVWVMIAVTIVLTGIIYWGLERLDEGTDRQRLGGNPSDAVFFSALTFTTHFEFQPRKNHARFITFSLTFWALVISSAYVANLASFLVVDNTPTQPVQSVQEAVHLGYPLCVWDSTAQDQIVSSVFPSGKYVRKVTNKEVYEGVRNGDCAFAITTVGDWEINEGNSSINGDCKLTWVGRVFRFAQAGFATKSDSGTLCTSLIRDSLDLHLKEMKQAGFIDRVWKQWLDANRDIDCAAVANTASAAYNGESPRLSMVDMGGIFILHFGIVFASIGMFGFSRWRKHRSKGDTQKSPKKSKSEKGTAEPFSTTKGDDDPPVDGTLTNGLNEPYSGTSDYEVGSSGVEEQVQQQQGSDARHAELHQQIEEALAILKRVQSQFESEA